MKAIIRRGRKQSVPDETVGQRDPLQRNVKVEWVQAEFFRVCLRLESKGEGDEHLAGRQPELAETFPISNGFITSSKSI
jgi:hypothetical protein